MFCNLPFDVFLNRKFNLKLSEHKIVAWNAIQAKQTERHQTRLA